MRAVQVACPVSSRQVDARPARLVALVVAVAMGLELCWPVGWIALGLAVDFFVRAFTTLPSPLALLARGAARALRLEPRLENAGPKVFAARLGWLMTIAAGGAALAGAETAARVLAALLIVCAGLESFAGICVGCHLYSALMKIGAPRAVLATSWCPGPRDEARGDHRDLRG